MDLLRSELVDGDGGAVAVFTSGGDAPGMNAIVRSVTRMAEFYGREVFAIYEGYQGLVDGGDLIRKFEWKDTQMIIHRGGTVIGSARCEDFRHREGRLKACKNLVTRNITCLVCCGGDGSLTGANIFKLEWQGYLEELVKRGEVTEENAKRCSYLNLVGIVGSIDNDLVYEGTLTTGTDTALHRIVDAIDSVQSTASSHQRTFVLEIMGRHCGYLAWAAGMATGADFVFIPELPPKHDDWETLLCDTLDRRRRRGARLCTVLVAEGAIDRKGNPIKTDYVRQVIVDRLKHDTRATILGHVQRGGHASAYDRIMGTIAGAMAVEKLRRSKPGDNSTIVGIKGYTPRYNPLVETIEATQLVGKYTAALDFENAISARKHDFKRNFEYHRAINRDNAKVDPDSIGKNILIVCSGAPAGGMNGAIRAGVHYAMNYGYAVYGAYGGFEGLCAGEVKKMDWMEVSNWAGEGGCNIRTDRSVPANHEKINSCLKSFNIHGVLVIGGFDAMHGISIMADKLSVPVAFVPATISNNVPGTDYSLGCDTSLNAIVSAIDTCKKSADSSNNRVFIIETQGRNCGFLAIGSAVAGGADIVYTREEGVTLEQMLKDIRRIKDLILSDSKRHFVIIRNENCSKRYDLQFMESLFAEEGKDSYTVRTVKLGHLCQGDSPSPLDRVRGSLFAAHGMQFLIKAIQNKTAQKVVIGMVQSRTRLEDLNAVFLQANISERMAHNAPWKWLLPLHQVLARYDCSKHLCEYTALVDRMTEESHLAKETLAHFSSL